MIKDNIGLQTLSHNPTFEIKKNIQNISFFDDKPILDELDFKSDILKKYSHLNIEDLLNIIVYGPVASGKTIKIYALLATILDRKVYDLKNMEFEEDRKTMPYKSSIYHIEINPINLGSNEKLFIQSFLKTYVETKNIGLNIPKIILIKNANLLSRQSQLALRKLIEKTSYTAKYIFEISNISDFNEALISRCLLIRVKIPIFKEIKDCIKNYSIRKNFSINDNEIDDLIKESNLIYEKINLKKIFGYYRYYLSTKKKFKFLYYDKFIEIFNFIIAKKISFVSLQKIRDLVNEMYINLVPMNELIMFLFNKLCDLYKDDNIFLDNFMKLSVECDINLRKGNKDCLHLEYYIISIIDIIHN